MDARVVVTKSFKIINRGFSIVGKVVEGTLRPGMIASIPCGEAFIQLRIKSVECVRDLSGESDMGVIFYVHRGVDIASLLDVSLENRILDISLSKGL